MSREIKFRAWNTIHNKMSNKAYPFNDDLFIAFDGTVCTQGDSGSMRHPEPYFPSKYENGKIILMQYTGLKDKNGKEIYECDEMCGEDAYGEKIKGVVKFIDGAFLLISDKHFFTLVGHSNHSHTYFRDMASQLEVCGLVISDLKVTEE